jgi:hypothetical protein
MMRSRLLRISIALLVVVTLSLGMVALAKKPPKPGGGCPQPSKWCVCYALYAPVVCGDDGCWYSNDCWASCAGWSPSECTAQGPGPIPFP